MSIEGMNALIQLRAAELEGLQATTQNSRQFQQGIQQQGLNHSAGILNEVIQKFDAKYVKDCAQADLKRLEAKLSRQQASAGLASNVASLVMAGSMANSLWNAGKDLFAGAKELGDISKSVQSPPIIPANAQLLSTPLNDSSKTSYLAGINNKGSETVQYFTTNKDGSKGEVRSATITGEDKVRILGNEKFRNMSFAQIHSQNSDLAEILVNDKSHSMAKGEAKDFIKLVDNNAKLSDSKGDLRQNLIKAGKLDDKGVLDHTVNVGKAVGGVMIETAQNSIPYLQAYLNAKDECNKTMDQIEAARKKLANADSRLNSIRKNIDTYNSRGAPGI